MTELWWKEADVLTDDDAGAELWAMAHLGTPMALRVAATLRIADHIVAGRRTARELADAVNADVDALGRLLRYLAARRVLTCDESGRFGLTPKGEPLRDDHPRGLRAMLDIEGAIGRADLSFVQLLHSIRTGEAAYPVQFGRPIWDDLAADPRLASSFDTWLGATVAARGPDILAGYDWGSLGHVVDVGGGDGSLLIAMLCKWPDLRGTIVDLPGTVEAAQKALTAAGLTHRSDAVPGSFFDPLPAGAGGYLLSLVVHDWNDEAAHTILRRCAEAAGRSGTVLVVENLGSDGESPPSGMDLRMLAHCGGKERGLSELSSLAAACGLGLVAVHPAGALSIVEFTAA